MLQLRIAYVKTILDKCGAGVLYVGQVIDQLAERIRVVTPKSRRALTNLIEVTPRQYDYRNRGFFRSSRGVVFFLQRDELVKACRDTGLETRKIRVDRLGIFRL